FNLVNAGLNGAYLGAFADRFPDPWTSSPRFMIGLALFLLGAVVNIWADNRLLALRRQGTTDYKIPRGGLFAAVSCPNYLGEIVEWVGFAVMCWSLPALSFAVWTAATLVPRSLSHHRWYRDRFADYPSKRRAVVPYLL
ncbi:MAG: 3-oxo-5-alpha-steroid 4-dehydrogenase, partial [Alphaproteobacteria bacterium]